MGTNRQAPAEAGTGRKKRAREIYADRMADRLIAAQWLAREAPAAALASQLSAPPAAAAQRNIRVTIGSDSFDVAIQARVERPEQSAAKRSRVLPFPAASD